MNNDAKVSEFVDSTNRWQLDNLSNCLPGDIIDKISSIHIPINNIEDKLACIFTLYPYITWQTIIAFSPHS